MTEAIGYSHQIPDHFVTRLQDELDPASTYESRTIPKEAKRTIRGFEKYMQAYFPLDPYEWMGIIDRREEPRFENSPVEVQIAIDRVASVASFWTHYANEWRSGRTGHNLHRSALEINPGGFIDTKRQSDQSKKRAKYESQILLTNWLGDGDFWRWGAGLESGIFPMSIVVSGAVHTGDAKIVKVPRETLDIPYELEISAKESWGSYHEEMDNLHHRAALSFGSWELPFEARKAIHKLLDDGEKISAHRLGAQMMKDWDGNLAQRVFTRVGNLFRERIHAIIKEDGEESKPLVAATSVANHLNQMLELARNSQR